MSQKRFSNNCCQKVGSRLILGSIQYSDFHPCKMRPPHVSREIDFVKKEEELRRALDEKEKHQKEELDRLLEQVWPDKWALG